MSSIRAHAQILLRPMPGTWKRVLQPALRDTDFPWLYGVWNTAPVTDDAEALLKANIVAVPDAECVRLRPLFIPHYPDAAFRPSPPGGLQYPELDWTHYPSMSSDSPLGNLAEVYTFQSADGTPKTYYHLYEPMEPHAADGVCLRWTDLAKAEPGFPVRHATAQSATGWQGFQFNFRFHATPAEDPVEPGKEAQINLYVALGDLEGDLRWYCLKLVVGNQPLLLFADVSYADFSSWRRTASPAIGWQAIKPLETAGAPYKLVLGDDSYSDDPQSQRDFHTAQFEVASGKLIISIDGSMPLLAPLEEDAGTTIKAVWAHYQRFVESNWHAAPLKFATSGVWESGDHQLGFTPIGEPEYIIGYAGDQPGNTTATVENLDSFVAKYKLTLSGSPAEGTLPGSSDEFCAFTPLVRSVDYKFPAYTQYRAFAPVAVFPKEIQIRSQFDYRRLQVTQNAQLAFTNNNGAWGAWSDANGQSAVAIEVGTTYCPQQRQMTGIAHRSGEITSTGSGGSDFLMSCAGRQVQLENPRWNLPWMLGWNSYYAIAFLAELGGIARDDLGFLQYLPDEPYTDLGSPEGGAYFLGTNLTGMRPNMFSGLDLWDIMAKIAYGMGYLLFFDAGGILQFRKFRLPTGVKRTFYESDFDESAGIVSPVGCRRLRVTKDLSEVRNSVTIVGVHANPPKWTPIVAHAQDNPSIDDPAVNNFLGYAAPFVWADSIFASVEFAEKARDGVLEFLRQPAATALLETWLQPDIFPLDVIAVASTRFGSTGKRFMVLCVEHALYEGSVGHTRILGRRMPEGF